MYRSRISPVVFYGCETWSVTLRGGGDRLRVFENRVLRKVFGPKRGEVTGEWRRLRKEELYHLWVSTIIRVVRRRAGRVAHIGDRTDG
jgi:hypothetical protein